MLTGGVGIFCEVWVFCMGGARVCVCLRCAFSDD